MTEYVVLPIAGGKLGSSMSAPDVVCSVSDEHRHGAALNCLQSAAPIAPCRVVAEGFVAFSCLSEGQHSHCPLVMTGMATYR